MSRTAKPATVQVPWGQQAPSAEEQAAIDAFAEVPDVPSRPVFEPVADPIPPSPEERAAAIKSAMTNEPVSQKSPFAPKPKVKAEAEPEPFEMGDAPSWGDLVRFVQKHGENIIQARYPQPRGECVDTIYRGVTVFRHPTTEVRHVKLGWITWEDAQYE